jgi:hypothetical protein
MIISNEVQDFLQGAVEAIKPNAGFFSSLYTKRPTESPTVTYERYLEGNAKLARFSRNGQEARKVGDQGRTAVAVVAPRLREKWLATGAEKRFLRSVGTANEPVGQSNVTRQLMETRRNFERAQEYMAAKNLLAATYTLTMQDGSSFTINTGIPAAQVSATVTASWATAGTDIVAQLDTHADTVEDAWGVRPTRMLMNMYTWRTTCAKNTEYQAWAKQNPAVALQEVTGARQRDFLGWPVDIVGAPSGGNRYDTTDYGATASMANFFPNNTVVMVPEDAGSQLLMDCFECPPEDDAPPGVTGWFSKAWDNEDPPGTWYMLHWQGIFVVRKPAVMVLTNNTAT